MRPTAASDAVRNITSNNSGTVIGRQRVRRIATGDAEQDQQHVAQTASHRVPNYVIIAWLIVLT